MKDKKKLTNYEVEKLLYKAAGYDEFVHYLMSELDAIEYLEEQESSALTYISLESKKSILKEVKDTYCYFKKNGKLPENKILDLKLDSEF